jgi:hypothetical protein
MQRTLTDQELIDAYASGLSEHRMTKLVMRGERFAIFRIPGHRFMNGQISQYGRSDHTLIRQGESWLRGKAIKTWEGRVSKKELRKALDEAEATLEGTNK